MPSLTTLERIERTEQRISELAAGKEIDVKHIAVLLTEERQKEFTAEWRQQQKLRLVKKPLALNAYETMHKQGSDRMLSFLGDTWNQCVYVVLNPGSFIRRRWL